MDVYVALAIVAVVAIVLAAVVYILGASQLSIQLPLGISIVATR